MSASELESLGLDAAVITKLQTVIGSDQVDDDAITADVLGDNIASVPATAQIHGSNVKVHAPIISKNFNGHWNRESIDHSKGTLRYKGPLSGPYKISVNLSPNSTVIVFKKVSSPPSGTPDALYVGTGTSPNVVSGIGNGTW